MSANATSNSMMESLRGAWQIPTFAAGLLVFGTSMLGMSAQQQRLSFPEQIEKVRLLREAGALGRARVYLFDLLAEPSRPADEKAVLHAQFASVLHQAESLLTRHNPVNVSAIVSNFQSAQQLGATLSAEQCRRLAEAFEWAGKAAKAIDAYQHALSRRVARPDRLRRRWVELYSITKDAQPKKIAQALDAMLGDPKTSAANYYWALEIAATRRLEDGDVSGARSLVRRARKRLEGTSERIALAFVEARCLDAEGKKDEALEKLGSLRQRWSTQDALWARACWLMGRLQGQGDRPQEALETFNAVLKVFQRGEIHNECEVGRAEALAALQRYPAALQAFKSLARRALTQDANGIDPPSLRSTLTAIAESRMHDGDAAQAAEFMQSALDLIDPSQAALRTQGLSRLVSYLLAVAQQREHETESPSRHVGARAYYKRAAELELELAALEQGDVNACSAALGRAATMFMNAGEPKRMEDVLARFVREFPRLPERSGALYRLAQARQADGRLADAAALYDEVLHIYPNTPDALSSMVPLAECLMVQGDDSEARGLALLLDIVEDRGPAPLVSPRARQYRDALLRLAEFYFRADEARHPNHFELAVERLEQMLVLYPGDEAAARCRFMLGDAYRRSSAALKTQAAELESPLAQRQALDEAARRMECALGAFEQVIEALGPVNWGQLTNLEQALLTAAYPYRGDCLFDLGRLAEAIDAYRQTAWRFENQPAAVTSLIRIVECHERLGQTQEAGAALARLHWWLAKTPESVFDAEAGIPAKPYWEAQVARLEQALALETRM